MTYQNDLQEAFASTDYRVEHNGQTVTLNVGHSEPSDLADWITAINGDTPAWLITAVNPRGKRISEPANHAREAVLSQLITRAGLRRRPAVNHDPSGVWPDERGWLVAGLEESRARDLARRLDQAAILAVSAAGVELVWTS